MTKPAKPYTKTAGQSASVGEAQALARQAAMPAVVGARFALILSILSFVVAAAALAVALR